MYFPCIIAPAAYAAYMWGSSSKGLQQEEALIKFVP